MSTTDDLVPVLKKLRLSGVLQTLSLRNDQAIDEKLSYPDFLFRLLNDEVDRRESKQLALRLKRARFDQNKSLEDFDFRFNPQIPREKVIELAGCHFVDRREVVLLLGPSGVGKSHLATALGQRACRAGYNVRFTTASQMFRELRAARADNSYERQLSGYVRPDLLIVDDLGLKPLRGPEPEDLYEVIVRRYERGALVFTSNRAVAEWYPLFGDALLASAAMDRLLHHAHVVILEGDSFRNPARRRPSSGAADVA